MLNNLIEYRKNVISPEIHDLLEAQLEELNNKKDNETFKAAGYCNWVGNLKKFASAISSGVFGGTALHKIINIKRLQKIIDEHNEVQKTIKGSQEFLNVVQKICR
ncbi:hypothetical protein RhiirA1_394404 [Rhizophagus irregularis]|uniref:Uncharacterized protein n=1 Tax=Rhizophagus irregularis TaxID=588596 RepID=A0A2I1E868_9GLOM|nr:hypothetical protein RhiirA1_394404 [Rhizophagus irregularis]PKY18301.1 hypothetical protein RhiirB3_383197 [Rhizophagus irregularis]